MTGFFPRHFSCTAFHVRSLVIYDEKKKKLYNYIFWIFEYLGKLSIPCIALSNTWLLQLSCTISRARFSWKWSCSLLTYCVDRVKKRLQVFVGNELFSTLRVFLIVETSQACRFYNTISMEILQALVPPAITFTAQTRNTTHIVVNHPYSLCIRLVRCKFYLSTFFHQTTAL